MSIFFFFFGVSFDTLFEMSGTGKKKLASESGTLFFVDLPCNCAKMRGSSLVAFTSFNAS